MRPRSIFATAAAAGVSLLLFGVAVPASATETADPFADARAGFTQLGLSSHESDLLLGKLANGEPLDSMTDGAVPVRTDQYVQVGDAPYAGDGDQVTVKWFADGSPAVTSTEAPTEPAKNATARDIGGCTYTSGSGYSRAYGCTVTAWWGTIQIAFIADYTLVQGAQTISAMPTTAGSSASIQQAAQDPWIFRPSTLRGQAATRSPAGARRCRRRGGRGKSGYRSWLVRTARRSTLLDSNFSRPRRINVGPE